MGKEISRIRYRFVGKVQHRGFRFACTVCAERAGVTGWVCNEADGCVTAEVQGDSQQHHKFVVALTTLVPGHGDGWSVGEERVVTLVEQESSFVVRH